MIWPRCTLVYSCFGFSLVWNISFGLFFVFDLWSCLVNGRILGAVKRSKLFPGLVLSSPKGSHLLHSEPGGKGTLSLQHHALHLVDGAPVLGVLGLGIARVDDLLVVVEQLLADRTLGVQVLVGGLCKAVFLQLAFDLRGKTFIKVVFFGHNLKVWYKYMYFKLKL